MENIPQHGGLYIPPHIMNYSGFSNNEKILISLICNLYSHEHGGCFASNAYLGEKAQVSEKQISRMLTKFKRMGVLEQVSFDGKTRVMKTIWNIEVPEQNSKNRLPKKAYSKSQTTQKCVGVCAKMRSLPYIENIGENKPSISPKNSDPERSASADQSLDVFQSNLVCSECEKKKACKTKPKEEPKRDQKNLKAFGKYKNVKLSHEEYENICKEHSKELTDKKIQDLDTYIEENPHLSKYKKKNHSVTVPEWIAKDKQKMEKEKKETSKKSYQERNREKVMQKFKNGQKYNDAECFINSEGIAFLRGQKQHELKFKEYGFDDQFSSLLQKFGIKVE